MLIFMHLSTCPGACGIHDAGSLGGGGGEVADECEMEMKTFQLCTACSGRGSFYVEKGGFRG